MYAILARSERMLMVSVGRIPHFFCFLSGLLKELIFPHSLKSYLKLRLDAKLHRYSGV